MHPKIKYNFSFLQNQLLRRILLTVFLFSWVISIGSWLEIYVFNSTYTLILFLFGFMSIVMYSVSTLYESYYAIYRDVLIILGILTLSVSIVTETNDELRLVWFYLISLASYILGSRKYGMVVSLIILAIIDILVWQYDLHYSFRAMVTFHASWLAFNIFMHYFLLKITQDKTLFEEMVEEEVQKRQTQEQILLRKYRMANMGEMIDAIAHQWRQPLSEANMILLNMEEELDNPKYLQEKIEVLTQLNGYMSQTIDDFRNLLHSEKTKIPIEMDECIAELKTLMKQPLSAVKIYYKNENVGAFVNYRNEFIQVLIILLSNAIEALEETKAKEKNIWIKLKQVDTNIVISIEDSAGGVDIDNIEKIFDPYMSSKEGKGGTGLGLYVAKIIVEETMKGRLEVVNTHRGAKFSIILKEEA